MMKTNNAYFENLRQIAEKWEQEKAERKERKAPKKPFTGATLKQISSIFNFSCEKRLTFPFLVL